MTPLGSPVTARLTFPLNPNCGTTAIVEFSELPGTSSTSLGAPWSVKNGALMVSARVVLAVRLPHVPMMVTVAVPGVAVLLAVNVSELVPVEIRSGANTALTPAGSPEATRVTLPLNP